MEFRKDKYLYRQADLIFYSSINGKVKTNLVEAKYSSGYEIKYELREPVRKYHQFSTIKIKNLIDEVYERKIFVKADKAFLVTNTFFEPRLIAEARKLSIETISGKELCKMKYGSYSTTNNDLLQQSINDIDINKNRTAKSTIYV